MRTMEQESRAVGRRRGQRGMAMVMVLGVIAVTLLMVVHAMTVCEVISRDSYASASRCTQRYVAESAADHAFWMHLVDRNLYPDRTLGDSDEARDGNGFEAWMADRGMHQPFESNCQVYIATVEKTIRINDTSTLRKYVDADDTDRLEVIDCFMDVLGDYTDSDSLVSYYGKENDDYSAEGYMSMPRNGEMQFAEEIYWLDGWADAVDGEVTIIPPSGKKLGQDGEKTSFFSASASEIQQALDLSDSDLEIVLEARRAWQENSVPLADSLAGDLYANILSAFDFNESNAAEYIVSAATDDGDIRVLFKQVREVNISEASIFADSGSEAFSIWRRVIY